MNRSRLLRWSVACAVCSLAAPAAQASFHFMQIEQVIGGLCSDVTSQAVQLRMRLGGQNLVTGARLVAYDAAGTNPVVLITFPSNVVNNSAGTRILVTSTQFSNDSLPSSDFTMTNLIPSSYLAAGRLTFESPGGTIIYWSLSWGGAAYTGSTTGALTNDGDGIFGPPYAGALPSSSDRALQFQGTAGASSTSNEADYAVTASAAIFTNNAGSSDTVFDCAIFSDGFESGNTEAWSQSVPP